MKSKGRRKPQRRAQNLTDAPPPPVPPDVDLRNVPIPISAFIKLAMSEFGVSRHEANKLASDAMARRCGAKGNA